MLQSSWSVEAAGPGREWRTGSPLFRVGEYIGRLDRDVGSNDCNSNGNEDKCCDNVGILVGSRCDLWFSDGDHNAAKRMLTR